MGTQVGYVSLICEGKRPKSESIILESCVQEQLEHTLEEKKEESCHGLHLSHPAPKAL